MLKRLSAFVLALALAVPVFAEPHEKQQSIAPIGEAIAIDTSSTDWVAATATSGEITACRSIYVGTVTGATGTVKVDMATTGTGITYTGFVAGTVYPFRVTKVYKTGTDATNLVCLY